MDALTSSSETFASILAASRSCTVPSVNAAALVAAARDPRLQYYGWKVKKKRKIINKIDLK
jgi:hypothetical protein